MDNTAYFEVNGGCVAGYTSGLFDKHFPTSNFFAFDNPGYDLSYEVRTIETKNIFGIVTRTHVESVYVARLGNYRINATERVTRNELQKFIDDLDYDYEKAILEFEAGLNF